MTLSDLTTKHTITAWIAALWSGEYDQVKYALHTDNGFCVNGVLMDQMTKIEDLDFEWLGLENSSVESSDFQQYEIGRDGRGQAKNTLPRKFARKVGMNRIYKPEQFEEAFDAALGRNCPLEFEMSTTTSAFLMNLNDKDNDVSFEEMGHVLYQIGTDLMDLDLPPKADIMALADEGSCTLNEQALDEQEGENWTDNLSPLEKDFMMGVDEYAPARMT
jgi:hypothetical protein